MPIDTMRDALRQLAVEASAIARDPSRSYIHRLTAFLVIFFAAFPFAIFAAIAVVVLYFQIKEQGQACMEAEAASKAEIIAISEMIARERSSLEVHISAAEGRAESALKDLAKSIDRLKKQDTERP